MTTVMVMVMSVEVKMGMGMLRSTLVMNGIGGDGGLILSGLVYQSLVDSTDVDSEVPFCMVSPSDL